MRHNVSFRVIDEVTGELVQEHIGHNMATNSMLMGIAHYLTGDGVFNQGWSMLQQYVPQYISLGTMGLINQFEDENHLPDGIGVIDYRPPVDPPEPEPPPEPCPCGCTCECCNPPRPPKPPVNPEPDPFEEQRFQDYMDQ